MYLTRQLKQFWKIIIDKPTLTKISACIKQISLASVVSVFPLKRGSITCASIKISRRILYNNFSNSFRCMCNVYIKPLSKIDGNKNKPFINIALTFLATNTKQNKLRHPKPNYKQLKYTHFLHKMTI